MARIAGVKTERDSQGNLASITINLKKHPEAVEALKGVGLIGKSALQQEIEENPEKFMTVEELRERLHKTIEELWD